MKWFIDGYEVSAETKIAYDRQQAINREREYADQRQQEQLELLRQIAKNTASKKP